MLVSSNNQKPKLYLACYSQLFAILKRDKVWSYQLDLNTYANLKGQFDLKSIPYRTTLDIFEDLPGDKVDISGACNSRVIFNVSDEEFHILQYNSYLMQSWYAIKISKSFVAKGFESRVEMLGSYSKYSSQVNSIIKRIEEYPAKPDTIVNSKIEPRQLSLFDLSEVAVPIYRRR